MAGRDPRRVGGWQAPSRSSCAHRCCPSHPAAGASGCWCAARWPGGPSSACWERAPTARSRSSRRERPDDPGVHWRHQLDRRPERPPPAADVNLTGLHELVAVIGPRPDLNADVSDAGDGGFAVRANQVNALSPATSSRVAAIADTVVPGRDVLLVTTSQQGSDPLDPPPAAYALAWNGATLTLRFETVPGAAFVASTTASSDDPEDQALPTGGNPLLADDSWVPVNADPPTARPSCSGPAPATPSPCSCGLE